MGFIQIIDERITEDETIGIIYDVIQLNIKQKKDRQFAGLFCHIIS